MRTFFAIIALVSLAGCGQTGPLYLPGEEPARRTAPGDETADAASPGDAEATSSASQSGAAPAAVN